MKFGIEVAVGAEVVAAGGAAALVGGKAGADDGVAVVSSGYGDGNALVNVKRAQTGRDLERAEVRVMAPGWGMLPSLEARWRAQKVEEVCSLCGFRFGKVGDVVEHSITWLDWQFNIAFLPSLCDPSAVMKPPLSDRRVGSKLLDPETAVGGKDGSCFELSGHTTARFWTPVYSPASQDK